MSGAGTAARILCPAGVFARHEDEMRRLTDALNGARDLAAKAAVAVRLQAAAEELLACAERRADDVNCRLCQEFSRLRVNTATLIQRMARLAS